MLRKFNSFIEKWMALVTPTCLLLGVCFPDIAKCGLPYVPAVFAFMTFAGALKSRFKDVANVFRHPGSLLIIMLLVHVVIPTAACGAGHLFFGNNMELITGMVLEFAVPTAVVSLMWVTIYDGNSPLSLSLVVRVKVALAILVLAASGYALGWFVAYIFRKDRSTAVSMMYGTGMRNISAGAVIAAAYFPGEVMFPVMIGTLFQQVLAALFGKLLAQKKEKQEFC